VKLVIRISDTDFSETLLSTEVARSLVQLLDEKHHVVIVHGCSHESHQAASNGLTQKHVQAPPERADIELPSVTQSNKTIVATLAALGIAAFGLCGADGNLVRTRRKTPSGGTTNGNSAYSFEAAAVSASWLEVITKNGGVPVLSNVALGPDRKYCVIEADQLAAASSVAWKADALIFLTREEGIKNQDGSVIRWFDAAQLADPRCSSTVPRNLLSQLNAGSYVLKHGVKRARILPISHSKSLASFYSAKIDFGTEVIVAS
jgi:acetylglutamate kinase